MTVQTIYTSDNSNGGVHISTSSTDTNTNQYARLLSKRRDGAISAVESAHAERTTQCTLDSIAKTKAAETAGVDEFEHKIDNLYNTEYKEWITTNTIPEQCVYTGPYVAEANTRTIKTYGEKQTLIDGAKKYIDVKNQTIKDLMEQLMLEKEKSADFEDQLEASLTDQDEADKILAVKNEEIGVFATRLNKLQIMLPPFLFVTVFYSYMFGRFGLVTVISTHFWLVAMAFYSIARSIQMVFQSSANIVESIINGTSYWATCIIDGTSYWATCIIDGTSYITSCIIDSTSYIGADFFLWLFAL